MSDDRARLAVKVVPGASRTDIAGWLGDVLRIRVTAPPERGKANAAVENAVAAALGVPSHAVRVVAGRASPRKVLEIRGLTQSELDERLAIHLAAAVKR
jgi:uncharacterized protein